MTYPFIMVMRSIASACFCIRGSERSMNHRSTHPIAPKLTRGASSTGSTLDAASAATTVAMMPVFVAKIADADDASDIISRTIVY